ncbi:UNVERIFIED_CONTAM: hypothetical protein FKN15_068673 [Acipenser sinensis]
MANNKQDQLFSITLIAFINSANKTFLVRVSAAAVVIESLSASPNSPSMGDNVTLSCRVSGGTQRSISWLKDGAPLPIKTLAHLALPTLAPSHCGLYTCLAQDPFSSDQADYRLTGKSHKQAFLNSILS